MPKKLLQWAQNNKLIIILCILSFCLFVSTVSLAAQNNVVSQHSGDEDDGRGEVYFVNDKRNRKIKTSDKTYFLPSYVVPNNYQLQLAPNMLEKKYDGHVEIKINVTESTDRITLHSNKLIIMKITLRRENDNSNITIKSFDILSDDREFLIVNLENEIVIGIYRLVIVFEGRLDNGLVGFYGSTLTNGQSMVASKFQPTYAREAFPCFDEPEFKATYDIKLVKPTSYIALSNMNDISTVRDNSTNTDTVTFATSVPMSTYLACFVICDFEAKETVIDSGGIGDNFILRSFAQKDQTHKIDFAQYIGKKATEFYIDYYQVPFPLPKLDMIAIPDYVSGATEHWGLITYRETSFLVDKATASPSNKLSVANTIAHELAHMWFGNLVTMKWWDEVWLNEGFASYMQTKALNAIEPSWTMLDQFLIKTMHSVLVTDAKLSSHPIVQTVSTPDQITAIFDAISYNKGSSVLRMLEGFVGEENFRKGVTDYLKKFQFGNTITQNLLDALKPYFKENNPDMDIIYIMDTWTKQMGYPVLNVAIGKDNHTYTVSQKRFLLDPEAESSKDSQFKYRWFVPVTYKTNKGIHKKVIWFPDTFETVTIKVDEDATWLKINNNQVGFYRVNYPEAMWLDMTKQLQSKSEQLTISDRVHLLNDVFALAEARHVSYDLALNLGTYLTVEEDYVPWAAASNAFGALSSRLINSLAHPNLQKYVQHLLKPLYEKQKWTDSPNDSVIQKLLRIEILAMAAKYEVPHANSMVHSMFLKWLDSHSTGNTVNIEPDLRTIVYYYGMKAATENEWDKLWNIYLVEEDAQEKDRLISALAAPRDTNILNRYLTLAWDETHVRAQDYLTVVTRVAAHPTGAAAAWATVRARWPRLVRRYTLNSRVLGALLPAVTAAFDTVERYQEMINFFKQYPEAGAGEAARRRALETVQNNIKWTQHNEPIINKWLANHIAQLA